MYLKCYVNIFFNILVFFIFFVYEHLWIYPLNYYYDLKKIKFAVM